MAEIEIIPPEDFRRELAQCDEPSLICQLMIQHGALHVINHLLRIGPTEANARKVLEQLEVNVGIIEQLAAEKGFDLPIVHKHPSST